MISWGRGGHIPSQEATTKHSALPNGDAFLSFLSSSSTPVSFNPKCALEP